VPSATVDDFIDSFLALSDPEKNRELPANLDLLTLVCSPELGAFPASPVQRALILAADGKPDHSILSPDRMEFHFGCKRLPSGRPQIVALRTGVRAAKSLIAAFSLIRNALTCQFRRKPDLTRAEIPAPDGLVGVRPGELVRALIVGPRLGLSRAPLEHIRGTMNASPILKKYIVKEKAESITIRRPDGAEVLIERVAADEGGANLRSNWLAGILFDEAAFHDDEDGVVNLEDNLSAATARLLPGAQAWVVSSPWSDDDPFNKMFEQYFGRPGTEFAFHSDTRSMNPTLDPELEAAERRRDPDKASREYDAVPLSSSNAAFFPADAIDKSVNAQRPMWLPPILGVAHSAGTDLGFRKNSSALALARPFVGKVQLAYHEERRPEKGTSLKPSEVVIGFARRCAEYKARKMVGDLHYADTAHEELGKLRSSDIHVIYEEWNPTAENKSDDFTQFRRLMQEGQLDLPNDPVLIRQLRDTKFKAAPGGKTVIQIPKHGHTHGDVMMAVIIACVRVQLEKRADTKQTTRGSRAMTNTGGF
jgi:hypothetical protein